MLHYAQCIAHVYVLQQITSRIVSVADVLVLPTSFSKTLKQGLAKAH